MKHSIPAFTIFEVTIVLAIMSVLVTMVTFSVNRLFDQMRVTEEIHSELNNFYQVRSTLWYDCITADSLVCNNQQFIAYKQGQEVHYFIDEGNFMREKMGVQMPLNIAVKSIQEEAAADGAELVVVFDWKGEELPWRFYKEPDFAGSVNQYFDKRNG